MRGWFTVALLLLAAPVAGDPLTLTDQHGRAYGLDEHADAVQVAIVVSARRLRRIKPWERAIRERYGDIPVLRVAHVAPTAPTEVEQVAAKLGKRLPPDAFHVDQDTHVRG